jgi:hypothetical protein
MPKFTRFSSSLCTFISQDSFTLFTKIKSTKTIPRQQVYTTLRGKFIPQNYMSKATIMYQHPSSKSHHNFTRILTKSELQVRKGYT